MRKCLLLLSIAALPLFAESITTTVRFDIKELSLSVTDGGDIVELAGYPALVQPGMPRLPRVVQTVVIPAGAEPTGVEVTEVEWQPVPGRFNIVPAQPDVPLPMPNKSFALPNVTRDAAVYRSTAPYPAAVVRLLDAGTMNGYRLAHVELRPVRYIPGTGELLLATRISYQLEYVRSAEVGTVPTQAQLEEAGRRLRQLVVNPGDVSRFAPRVSRSALSTLPPGNYPYVIISAPPVDTCFQRLADWKTRKGVPATVVTVSYITANYTGTDTQTKIRNFIIDAYQTWGTNYVLLGGSGDQKNSGQNLVPARRCYYIASGVGYYSDEDTIPCDLYYGGLDGTWNADGDNRWGELNDNADMYAEVHVGRASVYTVAQAQNFVNKVLTYEQNPPANYVRKMLLPAAILWSSYNERPTQESIARMTPTDWLDAKLYERTSTLSRTRMRDSMNSGFGMGHWVGHGDEYGIYMGSSPYLNSSDAQALTNGDKIGVHASIACFTGAWDEVPSGGDCFAEHLMNRVGGGTAAVLMNSRYGWGAYIPGTGYVFGPSERLDTTFCSAVLNQNNFRVGPALTYAKSSWVPYADSTGRYDMMRWCIYELNLFGDPELPIWTNEPATLTVAHAGTITTGMNLPYAVTVTTGASVPLESARVVLWKGNEVYASGLTNASGQVTLLVSPQTVGTMLLTVTKRNYRPHLGTVNVTAGPTYDVGCATILVPSGMIDSGTVVTPACTVANYGTGTASYTVRMKIGAAYNQTATVTNQPAGARTYVTFPAWTATGRGSFSVSCSTELSSDVNQGNDKQTGSVMLAVRDVGCAAIVAPSGTIDSGTVVTPACTVANYGTGTASYTVRMKIGAAYNQTATVTNQAAGARTYVTFPAWTATGRGSFSVSCSTELATDMVNGNNKATGSVMLNVRDVGCAALLAPAGTIDSGTVVTPACTVVNYGTATATYTVRMKIGAAYNQTATVTNQAAGARTYLTFPAWTAGPRGSFSVSCSTEYAADMVGSNNKLTGSVTVNAHDVGCVAVVGPSGTVDSGTVVTPACTVANFGSTSETYTVRMKIGAAYNQTATVTNQPAGARTYVTFPAWTATGRGSFSVSCSTELAGDGVAGNDKQTGTVTVVVRDVEVMAILAPTGTVDSGTVIAPQATVRNNGTAAATFTVQLTIAGASYSNTQTVTNLAAGAAQTVTFANWTALPRGGPYAVNCVAVLTGDMVPANNSANGSVTVAVRDVGCSVLLAPSGIVDSGTVVTPACTVANYGTGPASYTVRMRIGTSYEQPAVVTNQAAGARTYVTFPVWTATGRGTFAVTCSTEYGNDMVSGNDKQTGNVTLAVRDVGCLAILAPLGMIDSGTVVTPACSVVNYGTSPATYTVRMQVGADYNQTAQVTSQAPGARSLILFPAWTAQSRGGFAVSCATEYSDDMVPDNNTASQAGLVAVHDAAVTAVTWPVGTVPPGPLVPTAIVSNRGNLREPVRVFCFINSLPSYQDSVVLAAGLPVGLDTVISFSPWLASFGDYVVRCSVALATEQQPANNVTGHSFQVIGLPDVGCAAIVAPTGTIDTATAVIPKAWVRNWGSVTASFDVVCRIQHGTTTVHSDTQLVAGLETGESLLVTFAAWPQPHQPGRYLVACSTRWAMDSVPANDRVETEFLVTVGQTVTGWQPAESLPSSVPVREGGALCCDQDWQMVFSLLGNRTREFFGFEPYSGRWTQLPPMPAGASNRPVARGGALCAGGGQVYALKGNSTREFYRYDPGTGTWTALEPVPLAPDQSATRGRPVRAGASLAYVSRNDSGFVYVLKGYGTEFYRYDVASDTHISLGSVPYSTQPRYDKGSWLVYDGSRYLYLLQGRYNALFRYDVVAEQWVTTPALTPMPFNSSRSSNKKSGDGGCASSDGRVIYALKGNNTQEFWQYRPGTTGDTWVELETIPRSMFPGGQRKKVRYGGGIAYFAPTGVLYAQKGNSSRQFWVYTPARTVLAQRPQREGVQAEEAVRDDLRATFGPNPLRSGFLNLSIGAFSQPVTISIHDALGRSVLTRQFGVGRGGTRVTLDLRTLPAGVYLVRLDGGGRLESRKLVIEE